MDPSSVHTTCPVEEDEWDTEGFVIPSLGIENPDQNQIDNPNVEDSKVPPCKDKLEQIYLGPHGAPPQQKQQEQNPSGRKQRFKQKLKEADRKTSSGTGRENKVESLKELVGGNSGKPNMPKSSTKDWLDPHCNESQFERRNH